MQPSFHKPTPSAVGRNRKVPVTVETCGLYWPWRGCVCVGGAGSPTVNLIGSNCSQVWSVSPEVPVGCSQHDRPPPPPASRCLVGRMVSPPRHKSIVRLQRKNGAAFVLISYENTSRWVKLQLICQSRRKCGKNLTHGKKTRAGKLTIN